MEIKVTQEANKKIFKLAGRLDSATAGELEECFANELTADIKAIEVDVKDIDFISSKGLRLLVKARKDLGDGNVKITNPNNAVHEIFKISGLLKAFQIGE